MLVSCHTFITVKSPWLTTCVVLQVPGDVPGGQVTFGCYFDQTASTEVQVTPAAAAAAQQDVIPDIQEHMVDEFAAGDAAPQVEAKHQANGDGANSSVIEDNLIDEFAAGDAAVQIEVSHGAWLLWHA